MLKQKNYNAALTQFVSILTLFLVISCATQKPYVSKIEGKQIGITNTNPQTPDIEEFIKPYRENIDKDMNQILAYAPETMDKSKGEWQTTIGSLQADITLATANKLFLKRENKPVDICLLNHGGIRSMISKGNVTTRTAFELMPFENELVVVALKGQQIIEMVNYLISEKKPHPLAGMEIVLNKDASSYKSITIQGKPLDINKTYYVATNDYLYNGGDSMNFFKKGTMTSLDYKLRNVWIDYFKETDTIPVPRNKRIIVE
ncbi:5'-nucleotidase [Flavobacterium lindanitolerans]|uniref:5'-nucleotidase n=1 Tax=Flavobacterium lindanitolerans TaxID=428988 RepID=UPI002806B6BE|nr:5'-nucleotidase [Flavobacterium lindanitolerans]MDQ7961940.1 5'-nucleotidase [Flavobacterium lindanitolerans]